MASLRYTLIMVAFSIHSRLTNQLSADQSTGEGSDLSFTATPVIMPSMTQTIRFVLPHCDNDTTVGSTEQKSCGDNTTTTDTTTNSRISIIDTGSMSKETFLSFEKVARYLQLFLICLGIITNICNIVVFTQRRMRSATSTILTFLSFSEMSFAISELIVSSSAVYMGSKAYTSKLYWTLFRWVRVYMTTVFQRNSFCVNLSVAVERFIAVSFPLKANRILRRKNPVVFCSLMFLVILSIHIFNPLKMDVASIDIGRGYIHIIHHSQLYEEHPEVFEGFSLATKIMFVYVPLFGCLLMNVLMIMALKRHSKKRMILQNNQGGQQQHQDKREIQTTITILMSSFIFVLFSLPVSTTTIVQKFYPEYRTQRREHYLYTFITYLNGLLSLFSLSVDFIVYMILSRAFRLTFRNLARSVYSVVCCWSPGSNRSSNVDRDGPVTTIATELDNQSMGSYSINHWKEPDTAV